MVNNRRDIVPKYFNQRIIFILFSLVLIFSLIIIPSPVLHAAEKEVNLAVSPTIDYQRYSEKEKGITLDVHVSRTSTNLLRTEFISSWPGEVRLTEAALISPKGDRKSVV